MWYNVSRVLYLVLKRTIGNTLYFYLGRIETTWKFMYVSFYRMFLNYICVLMELKCIQVKISNFGTLQLLKECIDVSKYEHLIHLYLKHQSRNLYWNCIVSFVDVNQSMQKYILQTLIQIRFSSFFFIVMDFSYFLCSYSIRYFSWDINSFSLM